MECILKISNLLRTLSVMLVNVSVCAQASMAVTEPVEPSEVQPVKKMTTSQPSRITVPQTVLPLPGGLDDTPYFNSNSPEIVLESGVLLSTFPKEGKTHPDAHLNYPLEGRFDLFFHHITNATKTGTHRTLYLGLLVGNASNQKVRVDILKAISHATKPDSPFKDLDTVLDNEKSTIYAGPGDRVMLDIVVEHKQHGWHREIDLEPGETKLIQALPLPVKSLLHPLNGRTGLIRMHSSGPVYLATLSAFGDRFLFFGEHRPALDKWKEVLNTTALVHPRDKTPTVPGAKGAIIYGRVAGVARGSTWKATVTNDPEKQKLAVAPNQMVSFPINTVAAGTLGTNQVQAAPMLVRYPDTAYHSNGNYGVLYDLTLPLYNNSDQEATIGVSFQTPLKDWNKQDSLQFYTQPPQQVFFRGTLSFEWTDEQNKEHKKLIHLVEKKGQAVPPLVELSLKPHASQEVRLKFLYPADCTPPHVLTITTAVRNR